MKAGETRKDWEEELEIESKCLVVIFYDLAKKRRNLYVSGADIKIQKN